MQLLLKNAHGFVEIKFGNGLMKSWDSIMDLEGAVNSDFIENVRKSMLKNVS
jgi:hypothetical protein